MSRAVQNANLVERHAGTTSLCYVCMYVYTYSRMYIQRGKLIEQLERNDSVKCRAKVNEQHPDISSWAFQVLQHIM